MKTKSRVCRSCHGPKSNSYSPRCYDCYLYAKRDAAVAAPDLICIHCRRMKQSRPRGLCWRCFYAPGVKEFYPIALSCRPGNGVHVSRFVLPAIPTNARPGTAEKMAVMAERCDRGETLFHPGDATIAGTAMLEACG